MSMLNEDEILSIFLLSSATVSKQAMDDSSVHCHGYCPGVGRYCVPHIREESPSSHADEVLIDVMMSEDSTANTEPSEVINTHMKFCVHSLDVCVCL